jgi:hypothetical protein
MKPPIFVRTLSTEEREALEAGGLTQFSGSGAISMIDLQDPPSTFTARFH